MMIEYSENVKLLDKCDFLEDEDRNRANIRLLKSSVESKNISHAYLFYGNSMELLYKLALAFSASINCAAGGCGSCNICKNTLKGVYSNIAVIEAEGNILRIDEIAKLQRFMNVSSYNPGKKICIIKEAEIMNEEASNRLLKTLEEPPDDDSIFILLSEDISVMLPTIISRCMIFNWNFKLGEDETDKVDFSMLESSLNGGIKNLVKSKSSSFTESLNLSIELTNILKKMEDKIKLSQKDEIEKAKNSGADKGDIDRYLKILKSRYDRKLSKFNKLGISKVFDIISAWLEDIMAVNVGAEENVLNYKQNYIFIKENFKCAGIDRVLKLLATIEKSRKYLNYSIYIELCLDNIFLQFQNLCR